MNLKFEYVGETNIILESNLGCESGDQKCFWWEKRVVENHMQVYH
jgi:hypothetical protein